MSDQVLLAESTRPPARPPGPKKAPTVPRSGTSRKSSTKIQRAMRWLHVYTSMIALLVILFFGATGILLNHPTWLFGDDVTVTTTAGTLPASVVVDDGRVEFLAVSQFVRDQHGVGGEVTNFDQIDGEGSINYTGPGYGATVRFDVTSLAYEVTVREEGLVNAMRDLHSGSDTGSVWGLVIDVTAIFLVFVATTGLGIQIFMRKRRRSALLWLAVGSTISAGLIWIAMV